MHADGSEIPMSQVVLAGTDDEGESRWYASIARDISDLKHYQHPHGVGHAELHHRVDRLGRRPPFHDAEDRLVDHGQQDPVGDEARVVVDLDRRLAERRRGLRHRAGGLVGRRVAPGSPPRAA